MALNFPDSPTLNQVYTDTTSGFSYQWDGVVWQSYSAAASKNISIVDNIEGSFNGSTQTFSLAVSGTSFVPANAQQLRVVLGGIVQEPGTDYTVSGSNITFTTPPAGGLDCSIVSLGPAVPVSVVGDGTVTPAKLSTGGPYWNTGGDVTITGTGTTSLLVNGNARVTGILTIGTSSITLDGSSNEIKIGTGITISSTGITGSASTVTSSTVSYGLSGTPNLIVGFVTATGASISGNVSIAGTLTYEDVTNVDSVGLITARAGVNVTGGSVVVGSAVTLSSGGVNVSGVVTATSYRGDGSQLTGLGGAAAVTVLTTNTTLTKGNAYMINASGVVLTLPASPSTGDAVDILNNVSGIHTLARNGSTIMSIAENMEFGEAGVKFKVWYTGSTWSLF